jgi:hypothetical protein
MRALGIGLAISLFVAAAPLPAQQYGPEPDAATRTELLTLREAAWRTWFSNDQAGFQRVVPEELIALGWGGGTWGEIQRYGDLAILYTTFRVVLVDGAGAKQETTGRGTEIFVRRKGHWIHTGWPLDTVAD